MLVMPQRRRHHMAPQQQYLPDNRERPIAYALPATSARAYKSDGIPGGLSYAQHELLRQRKTPNGRLVEEQEVASLDRNMEPPARKQIILSGSPDRSKIHKSTNFESQPNHSATSFSRRCFEDTMNDEQLQSQWKLDNIPGISLSGGMDSVLNQDQPVQDLRYHLAPDSHVPTVLPAAYHAYIGPTASAGQEHFGPYWPDGTFNPYLPATIRDSRFLDRPPMYDELQPATGYTQPVLRRSGRLPETRSFQPGPESQAHSPSNTYSHWQVQRTFDPVERESLNDTQSPRNDKCGVYGPLAGGGLGEYRTMSSETIRESKARTSTLNLGRAAADILSRDQDFTWAHQTCADLLSKMQQESQIGRLHGPGHPKFMNRSTILPRPPRRAYTFSSDHGVRVSDVRYRQGYHSDSDRPSTAIRVHARRGSEQGFASSNLNEYGLQSSQSVQSQLLNGVRRGSDPSSYQWFEPFSPTPQTAAMFALNRMEYLCRESKTPWNDGMLLAGCLAYGLGNHAKALYWYQEILTQDPRHVEAMSNLAATLLALGRRDEALRYWAAAIKLRPEYFEAVEHLIGLLCSTQQAREAVAIIEYVEYCLRSRYAENGMAVSDGESDTNSRASSTITTESSDYPCFEYDIERCLSVSSSSSDQQSPGFGSSGFSIPGSDNGRLLALLHAKANMLYSLGNNAGAAAAFQDAILLATGQRKYGIDGLIERILSACISDIVIPYGSSFGSKKRQPILLCPDSAQQTAQKMFPPNGRLPGLQFVTSEISYRAAVATTSNSLLSLAKIYQDAMGGSSIANLRHAAGTREILALYYLSLSLQRSPSTANNVGILLAGVHQVHFTKRCIPQGRARTIIAQTGIDPGSGVGLALQYYNYGLNLDPRHAHLYTNLGSLLKDQGQLNSAIQMYIKAVEYEPKFDIALANLANAVKDQGRIADAINYYRRAVQANPEFPEAVCGLVTALNSVCNWYGRGGIYADHGTRDLVHVDDYGMMQEPRKSSGWMSRVVDIVDRQLKDGESWGVGILNPNVIDRLCLQLSNIKSHGSEIPYNDLLRKLQIALYSWSGRRWEGSRVVRLIERSIRSIGWQWYHDRYKLGREYSSHRYARPILPSGLTSPTSPTVLPFHTFTTPLSAKQVRHISQRNALRISVATLRSAWLPPIVYPPPKPPSSCLNVGYVSSDFKNHPLAHLMQSIFGLHDPSRVRSFCYATSESDNSVHRQQIERESAVFRDVTTWPVERLVDQIVQDGIHILVNLNGYTRGAKNEVFAARPAPIHMSFMGFAGTLGAEWCDYVFADPISVSQNTLSPWRRNVDIEDCLHPKALNEDQEDWMYAENVIFAKSTFFCVDHKQSAPDALERAPTSNDKGEYERAWETQQERRWQLRKELFPTLSDSAVILGNFNQLYKIDPATFRMYLHILAGVPTAVLWLLRFPDVGEQNLLTFAHEWAGPEVASRILFTDVAPKEHHLLRASVLDLCLDTPECNAHTTAADVIWSGTPIITWARWEYKMCSRMASSIVASALPEGRQGDEARRDLLVNSAQKYEDKAIALARDLKYSANVDGVVVGKGRLMDLRRMFWEGRWTSRLFDTARWVRDLETAYWKAWQNWEKGEGGDIWL